MRSNEDQKYDSQDSSFGLLARGAHIYDGNASRSNSSSTGRVDWIPEDIFESETWFPNGFGFWSVPVFGGSGPSGTVPPDSMFAPFSKSLVPCSLGSSTCQSWISSAVNVPWRDPLR